MRTKGNRPMKVLAKEQRIARKLNVLSNILTTRARLGQQLGQSFNGNRDLYDICGYPKDISFDQYDGRYRRQDIAARVNDAYPDATWHMDPYVYDNEDSTESEFEKAYNKLAKDIRLYHYLHRADKLAGIGQYAILFIGYDDGRPFNQEVTTASNILYLQPYGQGSVEIKEKDTNKKSKRYGMPVIYTITPKDEEDSTTTRANSGADVLKAKAFDVHYTRVLHIADNTLESDIYGIPRLQGVYNRLQDLETLCGGSTEMWWRSGFPGLQFIADPEATLPDDSDLQDEIEAYVHGLTRYMKFQNIEAKAVPQPGTTQSPKDYVDMQVSFISANTGIPVRILLGSERGELASSQDERAWQARVVERRNEFATPVMLRPLIDQWIKLELLPEPLEGEYKIDWPPVEETSELERMSIAEKKVLVMKAYVESGLDVLMAPATFMIEVMGMEPDEAQEILEEAMKLIEEEEAEKAEDIEMNPPPIPPVPPVQPPQAPATEDDGQSSVPPTQVPVQNAKSKKRSRKVSEEKR